MNEQLPGLGPRGQHALDQLRTMIIESELAPNERLVEHQLAAQLGMSRTPIREAIRTLHSEGFIIITPAVGAIVAPINPQDAEELYLVRGILESFAAAEAADKRSDEEANAIMSVLAQAGQLLDFPEQQQSLNRQFHQLVRVAANNSLVNRILGNLEPYGDRLRRYTQSSRLNREAALHQHEVVGDAIKRRDREAASDAMYEHMLSGWERLQAELDTENVASPGRKNRLVDQ